MDRTNQDQAYIAQLGERARAAQNIVEGYSQRRVDELAAALVYTLSRPDLARDIAEQALEETQRLRMEQVAALAAERGVVFDDFNACYEEMGLTLDDFYDQRHLTGTGAVKFTDYFACLLEKRYPQLHTESEDHEWEEQYRAYREKLEGTA